MDNRYNNYGTTEYPDNNNYYNSYESTSDYGMDNNYRNLYGNDNYDQSQYSSYGKHNSYYKSQGIQSIQGIQGEQGPSGITQLKGTNLYQKALVKTVTPGSGEPLLNAQVLCEEDDIAITGSFQYVGERFILGDGSVDGFINNMKDFAPVGNGTEILDPVDNINVPLIVKVWCFDNSP